MDNALHAAAPIANEMWRKTGKPYEIKAYKVGKIKQVDIWLGDNVAIFFKAKTWTELTSKIHKAWDTYLTLKNL